MELFLLPHSCENFDSCLKTREIWLNIECHFALKALDVKMKLPTGFPSLFLAENLFVKNEILHRVHAYKMGSAGVHYVLRRRNDDDDGANGSC